MNNTNKQLEPTKTGPDCFKCSWLDGEVYKYCGDCLTLLEAAKPERFVLAGDDQVFFGRNIDAQLKPRLISTPVEGLSQRASEYLAELHLALFGNPNNSRQDRLSPNYEASMVWTSSAR